MIPEELSPLLDQAATRQLTHVALLVRDYDEAIAWFTQRLGFRLVEDTTLAPGKRWVVVAPAADGGGCSLLLARAATPAQEAVIGRQGGGRVFLFLETTDFARDHALLAQKGVLFTETPRVEPYGTVAVFQDLHGNRWDLVERRHAASPVSPGTETTPSSPSGDVRVRRLGPAEAASFIPALADILIDCVEGGASVSFMPPMTRDKAARFWRMVADGVASGERALLVAEDSAGEPLGTVQLVLAMPENQPHRADLAKMLVHRRGRRRGVAAQLLAAAEDAARAEGRSLLVLDAVTDGDAARLYSRAGWQRVGDIPGFALMPDGSACSTTYFYKALDPAGTCNASPTTIQ